MDKIEYTSTEKVTPQNCADAIGSGNISVYATPSMVALMENAAMCAAQPLLTEGEVTVGAEVNIKHLRPSLRGAEIRATAILTQQEGRKLSFAVTAQDEKGLIGEGTHIRYIVNREKFLQKAGE